jgi:hypothetical protein
LEGGVMDIVNGRGWRLGGEGCGGATHWMETAGGGGGYSWREIFIWGGEVRL